MINRWSHFALAFLFFTLVGAGTEANSAAVLKRPAAAPVPLDSTNTLLPNDTLAGFGPSSGSSVSRRVFELRDEVLRLRTSVNANSSEYQTLRSLGANGAIQYHSTVAAIVARVRNIYVLTLEGHDLQEAAAIAAGKAPSSPSVANRNNLICGMVCDPVPLPTTEAHGCEPLAAASSALAGNIFGPADFALPRGRRLPTLGP